MLEHKLSFSQVEKESIIQDLFFALCKRDWIKLGMDDVEAVNRNGAVGWSDVGLRGRGHTKKELDLGASADLGTRCRRWCAAGTLELDLLGCWCANGFSVGGGALASLLLGFDDGWSRWSGWTVDLLGGGILFNELVLCDGDV